MAKFNSAWLIRKRQFRALTGVSPETFGLMVERLRPHWRDRVVVPKNRSGRPWRVGGLEDHLLVLLILYLCAITQDFMACLYQTEKSTVSRALRRIETLTARVLGVKRAVHVSREEAEVLIIDCTEQPIQRPSRKQRCWYSGKKKATPSRLKSSSRETVVSSAYPNPRRGGFTILKSAAGGRPCRKTLTPTPTAAIRGCKRSPPPST